MQTQVVERKVSTDFQTYYNEDFVGPSAMLMAFTKKKTKGVPLAVLPGKKKEEVMSGLVDLSSINIPSMEEMDKMEKEALRRREYAENAAKRLMEARAAVKRYEDALKKGGVLAPEAADELIGLRKIIDDIQNSGDPEIKKHINFAEFIEEIRNAEPTEEALGTFLEKAVGLGRHKIADKFSGKDVCFPNILFKGKLYVCPFEEKTDAQNGLNAKLWKFASNVREKFKNTLEKDAIDNMELFKKGETRKYKIVFLERVEGNRTWEPGTGYVQVSFRGETKPIKAITFLGGQGSVNWFNQHKDKWFSYYWLEEGVPDHVKKTRPEFAKFAEKAIKTLKAGIASYHSRNGGMVDNK